MKKLSIALVTLSLIFLISSNVIGIVNKNIDAVSRPTQPPINSIRDQDGRLLQKLQWTSPNGELPGSYHDYLKTHPLIPATFFTPQQNHAPGKRSDNLFSILVTQSLYPQIIIALNQYINDLENEGKDVILQTVSGGSPETIKQWVANRYTEGCTCFVFIGDITAAWVEVSGDVFPSDLFYMDLDGTWLDNDNDGDYEIHTAGTGDMGPEVYIGRIYATTLTYASEAEMINDYLAKTHAYRTGTLTQPWHGLEYVEEDWFDMDVFLRYVYNQNITRHDYGYYTTASDYLDQMALGHHFVQVCVHSYSGGHHFSTKPTESTTYAHTYVYSPSERPARLLLGSDDGVKVWLNGNNVFTKDRWGGWSADAYVVEVTLQQGWNRLLCKVSQEGGDHLLSARFTDMNSQTFDDLIYQINDPLTHDGESEFIRSWLLNGFHQDSSNNFWYYLTTNYLFTDEGAINPQAGDVMGGKPWTITHSGSPYVDLSAHDENDFGVIYGYARVFSESEQLCELWMGYDDGARVWLNGNEVIFDNRYGGFQADMVKVNVTLQPGVNRLLVKISEWMGEHGFSARFCNPNGSAVPGLSYDPQPEPISYIGQWLLNGPYVNPDKATRLSTDYLDDEATVIPSEGDLAPINSWERGIGNGKPFNLGGFYDQGDWVLSQDIQDNDPPVLFYNLFACGPGRFTDENYLAGSYIFNTTYGLLTIASSKSGSMLNFDDFYQPLSMGESVGEAFRLWFDAQAPFVQWEKEWYYGMVIIGDPTLLVVSEAQTKLEIVHPENGFYLKDNKIIPFFIPVVIGDVTVSVNAHNEKYGIERVEFFIDGLSQGNSTTSPYSWRWEKPAFFRHTIQVVAYDTRGENVTRNRIVWKFF